MIEQIVLDFMNAELDVPVYMEYPSEPKDAFVVMEKVGSSRRDFIYTTSIAFQSYSLTSLYNTVALDERVRAVADRLPELNEISGVTLSSSTNFTDTRRKEWRYQSVYDIYHY